VHEGNGFHAEERSNGVNTSEIRALILSNHTGSPLAAAAVMPIEPSAFDHITGPVLGSAIEVHRTLGPGLLESIYMRCLQFELAARNLRFVVQRTIPITYKGATLDANCYVDLVVEDLVVVEVKSVASLLPVHHAQTLTYMRLTGCPAGLLLNFNVPRLMDGVKRLINSRAPCGTTETRPRGDRADFPTENSGPTT
jgi:GxxExxY protein